MNGNKIDLGEILCQNIYRVHEHNGRSHPYPCMITALYRRAGLAYLGSDMTHKSGRVMGDSAIQKFRRDQGVGHALVEPASYADDDDAAMPGVDAPAPVAPAPAAAAHASPNVPMPHRLQDIEERQTRMERC